MEKIQSGGICRVFYHLTLLSYQRNKQYLNQNTHHIHRYLTHLYSSITISHSCRCFAARQPSPVPAWQSAQPAPGEAHGYHLWWSQLIQRRNTAPAYHSTPHYLHVSCTPPKSHINQMKQADHCGLKGKWVLLIQDSLCLVQHHCPSLLPHGLGQALNVPQKTDPITENKTLQVREGAAQHLPWAEPSLLAFRCCCAAPNFSPLLLKGLSIFYNQVVTFKSN